MPPLVQGASVTGLSVVVAIGFLVVEGIGFNVVGGSGLPSRVIAISAHARKCSCFPQPTQLVPSGSVPQLFAVRYVH